MPIETKRENHLQNVTEEFEYDLGSCLRWGKAIRPLLLNSDRYIPVTSTFG